MRKIDERIKCIILSILNCDITNAIYIFGSFGTDDSVDGESDIDIAWFTSKKLDLTTRDTIERFLEDVLGIEVDLVVVDEDYSLYLLYNIFENGELIFEYGENFDKWFSRFYDKNILDIETFNLYRNEWIMYGE